MNVDGFESIIFIIVVLRILMFPCYPQVNYNVLKGLVSSGLGIR